MSDVYGPTPFDREDPVLGALLRISQLEAENAVLRERAKVLEAALGRVQSWRGFDTPDNEPHMVGVMREIDRVCAEANPLCLSAEAGAEKEGK